MSQHSVDLVLRPVLKKRFLCRGIRIVNAARHRIIVRFQLHTLVHSRQILLRQCFILYIHTLQNLGNLNLIHNIHIQLFQVIGGRINRFYICAFDGHRLYPVHLFIERIQHLLIQLKMQVGIHLGVRSTELAAICKQGDNILQITAGAKACHHYNRQQKGQ